MLGSMRWSLVLLFFPPCLAMGLLHRDLRLLVSSSLPESVHWGRNAEAAPQARQRAISVITALAWSAPVQCAYHWYAHICRYIYSSKAQLPLRYLNPFLETSEWCQQGSCPPMPYRERVISHSSLLSRRLSWWVVPLISIAMHILSMAYLTSLIVSKVRI